MRVRRDIPQIVALRERVETKFGRPLAVHADSLALVAVIEMEQRQHISESTLERVWGYSTRGYDTISLHTLDVLSQYATGCYWGDFCHLLLTASGCESELFDVEHILSRDLSIGDCICIGWLPDRLCEVRYLGSNRFVAERCKNSKMQSGDTFSCLQFSLGKELMLNEFATASSSHKTTQTYLIGAQHGISTLRIKKSGK